MFFTVAVSVYIPTNKVLFSHCKGSLYSTQSLAFIAYRFLDDGHSDFCEVIPHSFYDGILLSHKKEQNWLIYIYADGPRVCHKK